MHITDLPPELLALLPYHLPTLVDLYALLRTSRCFYGPCSETKAKYPPILQRSYGHFAIPPHPHVVLSGIARQIADWAVEDPHHRQRLWCALHGPFSTGLPTLLALGEEVARLSIQDVRALHQAKVKIVEPMSRIIDQEVGRASRSNVDMMPEDDEFGSEDSVPICRNPLRTLYNFIIYCELFHHSIDEAYGQLPSQINPLSAELRLRWMRWCMPDADIWNNFPNDSPFERYLREIHEYQTTDYYQLNFSTTRQSLPHLLYDAAKPFAASARCSREDWARTAPTRDQLAVRILEHQGLHTLRLLLPGGVEAKKDMIADVQEKVEMVPLHRIDTHPNIDENEDLSGWYSMMNDAMICLGSA